MAPARKAPKSSMALGILIALASMLGALNVALVSLWGAKLYCGPAKIAVKEIKPPKKQKRPFWKRKQEVKEEEEPAAEPSALCKQVWRVLDYLPYLTSTETTTERPAEIDTTTCTEKKKKNPFKKILDKLSRKKTTTTTSTSSDASLQTAFSQPFHATKSQEKLMHRMAQQFREEMQESPHVLDERLDNVAWGSNSHSKWWLGHDGGPLVHAYLRVMDWPQNLRSTFPFKLCIKGCSAAFALEHTFQWRETFKPWLMCPSAITENAHGFVYFRGRAKSLHPSDNHGHGMVWIRAVAHDTKPNPTWYFRALLNSLDMAVSDTLQRSHHKVGKFNVVIDANGASFSLLPSLGDMKKGIVMLQDHYPNRLGIVVLANFSRVSEFLLTMIKPLITKEVRDKIYILPKDAVKRQQILEAIVEEEYIPDYLGGQDTYRFDAKEYYSDASMQFSDQEAMEYLTTMPYHA